MVRRTLLAPSAAALLLCTAMPAAAQTSAAVTAPAHISFVEGVVVLERDGRIDDAPGNMPLLSGDRVRTRAGRAEILFADGSALHLDRDTTLDLQSDELVRLIEGRLRLSIPGPQRNVGYRVDAPHAWLQILEPGEYRITFARLSSRDELEAAVLRGSAELINEDGRTALRAGERAFARADAAPSYSYVFNSANWDAFDRWSEERRGQRLGISAQYLPDEVRSYAGTLDQYGAWRYESSYGYVWYPRVDVAWRPYYHGRWSTLPSYGWTWIGSDPWGWPTHHYGRWGFSSGAWFWIPGRSWGPAWVSWAYAPGYVSWCPLGWNNRPVFQIAFGVNVHGAYDPWRAWTVVPQRHFGNAYVNRVYVAGNQIDVRTRGAFTYRNAAPDIVGRAAPRVVAPIRVAGTGPARSTSPVLTNQGENSSARFAGAAAVRPDARAAARPGTDTRPRTDAGLETRPGIAASRSRISTPANQSNGPTRSVGSTAERATPARPVVRSEREVTPRPVGDAQMPQTRQEDRYRAGGAYERAPQNAAPDRAYGAYDRRVPLSDRPAYSAPSSVPSVAQPSRPMRSAPPSSGAPPASAGPSAPAGPPASAAPPQSPSRGRGDAPSRGTAVRRPGGGR